MAFFVLCLHKKNVFIVTVLHLDVGCWWHIVCLGVLISTQDGELVVIFKNNGREYEEKPRIHDWNE